MVESLLYGFFGAVLGGIISFLTLRFNYKELYARTVSSNRMAWINKFREEVAIIAATMKCGVNRINEDKNMSKIVYDAEKARARLLTRINMNINKNGNEYNKVLSDILNDIDFSDTTHETQQRIDILLDISRKILETEWKRVKNEAGGKKYDT